MKQNKPLFLALAILCTLNLLGHLVCLPFLPEQVPIHWNFSGEIDGWGPKWSAAAFGALPLGILLLLGALPYIDPKGKNFEKFGALYRGTTIGFTLLFCLFSWVTELSAFGFIPDGSNLVGVLIGGGLGFFFILLGNYMPRIKQNYTFGCRTPWSLADPHNWERTQRMGGITFIVMGIALLLNSFLAGWLGEGVVLTFLLIVLLGGTGWIFLYSFLVYKRIMK